MKSAALREVDRNNTISVERAMLEIISLTLQTDPTRFVTLHLPGNARIHNLKKITKNYHKLNHHKHNKKGEPHERKERTT